MTNVSYRDLEIYKMAHRLAVEIHKMTLAELPIHERFEEASQIRRAAKSTSTNIVEGFGRGRYKAEFLRFLTYSHASCDETLEHVVLLKDTSSLSKDRSVYFIQNYETLSKKINLFIQAVERHHKV
jgi:four helix bundle protein